MSKAVHVEPAHQEVFTRSGRWRVRAVRRDVLVFEALTDRPPAHTAVR